MATSSRLELPSPDSESKCAASAILSTPGSSGWWTLRAALNVCGGATISSKRTAARIEGYTASNCKSTTCVRLSWGRRLCLVIAFPPTCHPGGDGPRWGSTRLAMVRQGARISKRLRVMYQLCYRHSALRRNDDRDSGEGRNQWNARTIFVPGCRLPSFRGRMTVRALHTLAVATDTPPTWASG